MRQKRVQSGIPAQERKQKRIPRTKDEECVLSETMTMLSEPFKKTVGAPDGLQDAVRYSLVFQARLEAVVSSPGARLSDEIVFRP